MALLATIVLSGLPARAARSEPAAAPDTAVYHVPPITVQAARPRTTPGGASALEVGLDSTRIRPAPTLEEVLRTMPLVVVRANSRGEAQPALRGGEDRQIAVLVDGVPITLSWDHRSDLSAVPLTAARRLTLHRGLSSLLLGPNALAGAIEVDVSRGGQADAPPRLTLDAGVDHSGARAVALGAGRQLADRRGLWVGRAGAGYRGSDGAVLAHALRGVDPATRARLSADGERRLNTDVASVDGFVSLRRVATGGAWAALTGSGYRMRRGVAPEAHTVDPRLWRYPFQARALGAVSAGTGMRETPWGRGDLEFSLGADAGRTEIDEYDALDYRTVAGGERDDDRTWIGRLVGDHDLGERGDLRFGATWADVSHDEVLNGGPRARYRQRLWSLATETDWRVPFPVPLRVSAGGAADGADTPASADKPPLARLWDWGARAGATAVLARGAVLVHASGGRRARFPALRELYSGSLGRFLENPGLRPEVQWSSEAGATVRRMRGQFQVVGYHQVLEDAITRVSVATPGGSRFQRVNLGRVTADGLEILGDRDAGALRLGGSAALQRVRALAGGGATADLEYEPAAYGGVWIEAPLPGRVRLGCEAHGTAEQRYIDLDRGTFATLAPSVSLDLRASRGFDLPAAGPWRRLELLFALENAADQPIFDQAGLPRPGRIFRLQARLQ